MFAVCCLFVFVRVERCVLARAVVLLFGVCLVLLLSSLLAVCLNLFVVDCASLAAAR